MTKLDVYMPYDAKPGRARRALNWLGSTWGAAPLRRMIQSACFMVFLALFFYVCWPYGGRDYAEGMRRRQVIPAETFLTLDPLVSLSTAIAARTWAWSLAWAGVMLAVCLLIPRGFCGYVCPLGTLIDLFDWSVGKRVQGLRLQHDGWWTKLKYYVLAGTLAASAGGVMLGGFVAAIPVVTRGLMFLLGPVQMGTLKGWYLVPPMNAGHWFSIALFLAVLGLGFLRPRFWCRHVCPTGAIFSLANALRLTQRTVNDQCIQCDKCRKVCPFDAIYEGDYSTRATECTWCQTCGGVCPTGAIGFGPRAQSGSGFRAPGSGKRRPGPGTRDPEPELSRRGVLCGSAAGLLGAMGIHRAGAAAIVRPPGSVPEPDFLRLCIRCGECFKACPNNVLQPMGFEGGLDCLWTPKVVANWSGCEPTCTNCGQVCPTSAIRALPIGEKRGARMGLAFIDETICLPHAGREACQMCVDECKAAGYDAIEFRRVRGTMSGDGSPVEGSGFLAPVVLPDKCVGCGLCQTRCHGINVTQKHLLTTTAILVEAGEGKEDRIRTGSYLALREKDRARRQKEQAPTTQGGDSYLPDFLK